MNKAELLKALAAELEYLRAIGVEYIRLPSKEQRQLSERIRECRRCASLFEPEPVELTCKKGVKVVFVLATPEDRENLFSPEEEELMKKIIKAMELGEEDHHITALVRCAAGRKEFEATFSECIEYFEEELSTLNPLAIVTLGELPLRVLTGECEPPERVTGRFYHYRGIRLMPVVHPEELLEKEELKRDCWMALKKVMALYR